LLRIVLGTGVTGDPLAPSSFREPGGDREHRSGETE
jgi:hypothetical protein